MKNSSIKSDTVIPLIIWLLSCSIFTAWSLALNEGRFIYTLDDPYIHLAVAEEIAHAGYGVNPGEFTAPSSSIIWPFLLAPLVLTDFGEFVPLILNIAFGSLTVVVLAGCFRKLIPDQDQYNRKRVALRIGLSLFVLTCSNSLALVFSGMEHNLQFLLVVCIIDALIVALRKEKLSWWHYGAIAVAPLVRYENLAFVGPIGLYLFVFTPRTPVVIAGIAAATGIILFSLFLYAGNGSPLPNSIVAKALLDESGPSPGSGLTDRLENALSLNRGCTLAILVIAALPITLIPSTGIRFRLAVGAIAFAGLLHLLFGPFGWYNRYEAYVIGGVTFGLIALAAQIAGRSSRLPCYTILLTGTAITLFIALPYVSDLVSVPLATNNIHRQQFQMHRFLTDYWRQPVAVNDLGLTSFRNEKEVLDLWGLASRKALDARLSGIDPIWMDKLAKKKGVKLIIIYESWFPERPANWIKIAELSFSARRITPAGSSVTFYSINEEAADEAEPLLRNFRKKLPSGAAMRLRGEKPLDSPVWLKKELSDKMIF